ncbi:right-handed parallel beta-helix repeat-containing protein [Dactylosporangium sp. AC04546]|uniref:right-handed parallel beta-helix repeat-containing protein n=1 Tax=Dactylosporangium sp. AC04546 TaxID=2862460 RepID=UPI001EE1176E|nr:right-handed parallel beta-helix repeat-containing protein [Dactylosporangium sp. AC04546]WVK84496.1 right-handed parallel beta-helix repeat-containing protein [Dactylosporangium sp. AC04546]
MVVAAAATVGIVAADRSGGGQPGRPSSPEPHPSDLPGSRLATDLGLAATNNGASNREKLVSALSGSSASVVFPPGDYLIDNGGTSVMVKDFSGQLVMLPGARLVFTDSTKRGLIFDGGNRAKVSGLTTAFATMPTSRNGVEECITFQKTTDTLVENIQITGAAAAGLLFWECTRPMVSRAVIRNTMADGLHFANCQDGRADQITTLDTGDDGVAFVNYASGPPNTGGVATNITVTRSKSRGVSVVGQSGVTVRDVRVEGTAGHGLYCAYEAAWKTRTPSDVVFERAQVISAGSGVDGVGGGNSGVRVDTAGPVVISKITVEKPGRHGFSIAQATVTVTDSIVRDTPEHGFHIQDSTCTLDRLTAEGTNGIGLNAAGCARLEFGSVTLRNTARTTRSRRAVSLEANAYVFGGRTWVADTQNPPTGYVLAVSGNQRGNLGTVVDHVASADVVMENTSGLPWTPA